MKIIFNDLSEPIKEKLTNALLEFSTMESRDKIDDFLDQIRIVIDDCNKSYIVIDDFWFSNKMWRDRFKVRIKNVLNVKIEDNINDFVPISIYSDLFIKSLEEQIERYRKAILKL